jgi:hypothetical protein
MRTCGNRTNREKGAEPIWFAALTPTRTEAIDPFDVQGSRWLHDDRRSVCPWNSEPEAAQPLELLLALPRR